MYGMCLLFMSNDATVDYSPEGSKFKVSELEQAVGGPFNFVVSSNEEKVFEVNQKNNTELLSYNINVNYLYRRLDKGEKVLKGDVLVSDKELIDDSDYNNKYLFSETNTSERKNSSFENDTYENRDSNFEANFS